MSYFPEKFRHSVSLPGPALAIWLVASYSLVTGFPGKTVDSCETVLLTVQYNLFRTSILIVYH